MAGKIVTSIKRRPGLYAAGAGVVAVICVVSGYTVYNNSARKPTPSPTATQSQSQGQTANTLAPVVSNYDGTYRGTGTATEGLTGATVMVSGSSLAGTGTYKGTYYGVRNNVAVNITGTVNDAGAVKGTFQGKGSIMGQTVNVSGTFTGTIKDSNMACSWKATAMGVSASGKLTLKK